MLQPKSEHSLDTGSTTVKSGALVVVGHAESTKAKVKRLWASVALIKALPGDKREALQKNLQAARETGELLIELDVKPGRPKKRSPDVTISETVIPTLKELKLTKRHAANCKKVAATSPERFAHILVHEKNLTMAGFLRAAYPDDHKPKPSTQSEPEASDPEMEAIEALLAFKKAIGEAGIKSTAARIVTLSKQQRNKINRALDLAHDLFGELDTLDAEVDQAAIERPAPKMEASNV